MGRVRCAEDGWVARTGGEVRIFGTTSSVFFWSGRNVSVYIISQTPKQILEVTSPSACHLHNARDNASFSMPPTQLTRHFHREHLHPVYLGTRYIHSYFFSLCRASAAASTDVKKVFKSISSTTSIHKNTQTFLNRQNICILFYEWSVYEMGINMVKSLTCDSRQNIYYRIKPCWAYWIIARLKTPIHYRKTEAKESEMASNRP